MNTVPRFAGREELADGFERLIEREFHDHRRHLLATARSILRNSEDAEDAVQVAFILAWRSRHQLPGQPYSIIG
jgi:DNA-directed RNA polymerase specialized sigma24 family protein